MAEIQIGHGAEGATLIPASLGDILLQRPVASPVHSVTILEQIYAELIGRILTERPDLQARAEFSRAASSRSEDLVWLLPADISENDVEYQIALELPGIARDDVSIELTNRLLMVRGVFKPTRAERTLMSTRRRGPYEFQARFPEDVEPAEARARLTMGVLHITVPLSKDARLRTVVVEILESDGEDEPS